jgi:hypothetical protein
MAESEELAVLREVTRRLDRAKIPYMVTGSIAANFYTVPRMTRDIDIVVVLSERGVGRFLSLFEKDFYLEPETVRRAVKNRGMFNLIHNESVIKIDFVVRKDSPYRRREFSRRKKVSVDDQDFYIVAPEDLILSKLEWAKESKSEVQLKDTSPQMERRFWKMLLERSGEQRLKMGCSMHATSRALVKASLLAASPAALKRALFLCFYGDDFDPKRRGKILRALCKSAKHDGKSNP